MSQEDEIKIILHALPDKRGEAHIRQSASYPKHWEGQVPVRVLMTKTVRPDLPFLDILPGPVRDAICKEGDRELVCEEGKEYDVGCNSHGAVWVIFPGTGTILGLKPDEFYITAWEKPEGVKREGMV